MVDAPAEETAVGFQFPGEDLKQGGDGDIVGADKCHPFSPLFSSSEK